MNIEDMSDVDFVEWLNNTSSRYNHNTARMMSSSAKRITSLLDDDFSKGMKWIMTAFDKRITSLCETLLLSLHKPKLDNVFTEGAKLEAEGFVFNFAISRACGCGDVYIHPDGTVAQLDNIGDGNGTHLQKWDSFSEFQGE